MGGTGDGEEEGPALAGGEQGGEDDGGGEAGEDDAVLGGDEEGREGGERIKLAKGLEREEDEERIDGDGAREEAEAHQRDHDPPTDDAGVDLGDAGAGGASLPEEAEERAEDEGGVEAAEDPADGGRKVHWRSPWRRRRKSCLGSFGRSWVGGWKWRIQPVGRWWMRMG